jgi:hypothetical protein
MPVFSEDTKTLAAVSESGKSETLEKFVYDSHGKKDPFNAPAVKPSGNIGADILSKINLQGVLWDEKKPMAIINGDVVGVGDDVGGIKVVDIKRDKIVVDKDGEVAVISLNVEDEMNNAKK